MDRNNYKCTSNRRISSNFVKYIPQQFFKEKNFIIDFFKTFDYELVKKHIPEEIEHFFSAFGVNKDHSDFFQKYSLSKELNEKLTDDKGRMNRVKL